MGMELRITGLRGLPEVRPGDDLGGLILGALADAGLAVRDGDVLVVTQKVVSKAEGRLVRLADFEPSAAACAWAVRLGRDPRLVELILRESARIVRMDRGILIAETHHGFICANAGVDTSNVPDGMAALLPEQPDASAERLRTALGRGLGVAVGVIVSDTFGRPWREGQVNVAIGAAGVQALADWRGLPDAYGRRLQATVVAVADEIAAAAELVMGKAEDIPVALVSGAARFGGSGSAGALIRRAEDDLFR